MVVDHLTENFIRKSIIKHGEKYDYSKTNYINSNTKVEILCKTHGEFLQVPHSHLSGRGCKKCGNDLNTIKKTKTKEDVISEAISVHGNKYDYSKVNYVKGKIKVTITCKEHGDFQQTLDAHICGNQGCPNCGIEKNKIKRTKTQEQYIKEITLVHGNTYDYSKVKYINDFSKICISCKIHGDFFQKASNHLLGRGCNLCANIVRGAIKRKSKEKFIEDSMKVHGDKYDYSNVEYTNSVEKVSVICKNHGIFNISPSNHISGKGCSLCIFKGEEKLYIKLKKVFHSLERQCKFSWCKNKKPLPYDFCIPEYKILIEIDGRQHFEKVSNWRSNKEQFIVDKFKEKCANDNGYKIIRLLQEDVFYDKFDWFNLLTEKIEHLNEKNTIENEYICKNNEYVNYY